jgi:hypothetical protein
MATGRAGSPILATFPLTFLVTIILGVSLVVPLLFTAATTLLSSGDTALLTTAGKACGEYRQVTLSKNNGDEARRCIRDSCALVCRFFPRSIPLTLLGGWYY